MIPKLQNPVNPLTWNVRCAKIDLEHNTSKTGRLLAFCQLRDSRCQFGTEPEKQRALPGAPAVTPGPPGTKTRKPRMHTRLPVRIIQAHLRARAVSHSFAK
jgi:hypothetical protein